VGRAILNSQLHKNKSDIFRFRTVYAALLLDSKWDSINETILLHAALSAPGNPNLGIFGSHLTHAWPENEDQLISRFLDSRAIDFSQLANDDSPTKYMALNTGLGAFLQMVAVALTIRMKQ
jgi:hypothetical protein